MAATPLNSSILSKFLNKTSQLALNPPTHCIRFSIQPSQSLGSSLRNSDPTDYKLFRSKPISCSSKSPENKVSRDLHNAASIGAATVASKILGLIREITLASVFGVGPVVTAFKHASVIPGFFLSVVGGVNGPIHLTMSTSLSKLSLKRRKKLVQNTTSLMFLVGCALGALIFIFAESIIYVSAPGLWISAEGMLSRRIAISQLKLMIPCIIFSGPIGLGFGYLSAAGDNFLACISPALSSIMIIASCAAYILLKKSTTFHLDRALFGGIMISCGASFGAFCQWLMQVILLKKGASSSVSTTWLNILKDKDVHELLHLMLPATLISGMAQISSFTDLYFASFIPAAAAGLSYAHLIAMSPLGLLSSVVLLPLLPTISGFAKPKTWPKLVQNLKQAVMLCMVTVLPIISTTCVLVEPTLSILFQWPTSDRTLVSSLLLCYSLGSPFLMIRELLVMVFYALGDSQQPLRISMAAIMLNAFLDWLFVTKMHLGAQGLALSTSLVISLSVMLLFHLLSKKLIGLLDGIELVGPLSLLVVYSIVSGCTTLAIYNLSRKLACQASFPRFHVLAEVISILLSASLGICSFFLLAFGQFPELKFKVPFKALIDRGCSR